MEKEFLPYEQALALKELGFDEECLAVHRGGSLYGSGTSVNRYYEEGHWRLEKNSNYNGDNWIAAPTFSQAFRWFREEYGVECFIKHFKPNDGYPNGYYCISNPNKYYSDSTSDWCFTNFKSYEEAELECLKKLIEIVKK